MIESKIEGIRTRRDESRSQPGGLGVRDRREDSGSGEDVDGLLVLNRSDNESTIFGQDLCRINEISNGFSTAGSGRTYQIDGVRRRLAQESRGSVIRS